MQPQQKSWARNTCVDAQVAFSISSVHLFTFFRCLLLSFFQIVHYLEPLFITFYCSFRLGMVFLVLQSSTGSVWSPTQGPKWWLHKGEVLEVSACWVLDSRLTSPALAISSSIDNYQQLPQDLKTSLPPCLLKSKSSPTFQVIHAWIITTRICVCVGGEYLAKAVVHYNLLY